MEIFLEQPEEMQQFPLIHRKTPSHSPGKSGISFSYQKRTYLVLPSHQLSFTTRNLGRVENPFVTAQLNNTMLLFSQQWRQSEMIQPPFILKFNQACIINKLVLFAFPRLMVLLHKGCMPHSPCMISRCHLCLWQLSQSISGSMQHIWDCTNDSFFICRDEVVQRIIFLFLGTCLFLIPGSKSTSLIFLSRLCCNTLCLFLYQPGRMT